MKACFVLLFSAAMAAANPGDTPSRQTTASIPTSLQDPGGRAFLDHFSPHHPSYFLYGFDDPAVKFQFSFKYRMVGDTPESGRPTSVLNGVHFGYTQRSLWDIYADSSPFFDTSYMPEFLFESLAPRTWSWKRLHFISYQIGAQHESNGRDGLNSRSLNMVYLRPAFAIGDLDRWNLLIAPRFDYYVADLTDNPDIKEYRGHGSLYLVFGKHDNLAVAFTGRVGKASGKGSVEVNATYPVRIRLGNAASFFHVQYFAGWGESLRTYNAKTATVRAGFSIVR